MCHNNKVIHNFDKETTNEQILDWVRTNMIKKDHPIFDNPNLWRMHPTDNNKIIHETIVSYTELHIIQNLEDNITLGIR